MALAPLSGGELAVVSAGVAHQLGDGLQKGRSIERQRSHRRARALHAFSKQKHAGLPSVRALRHLAQRQRAAPSLDRGRQHHQLGGEVAEGDQRVRHGGRQNDFVTLAR